MARRALIFALGVLFVGSAFGGDQRPLSSEIQKQLSTKYPNHKVVNWCSGKFVGKEQDAVAVLRDESKKQFLVLWVMSQGGMRGMVDVQKVARLGVCVFERDREAWELQPAFALRFSDAAVIREWAW